MATSDAWALACRLFAAGTPVFASTLSPCEQAAIHALGPALKPATVDHRFALCPYCLLHSGQLFADSRGGRVCRCPGCGAVPVTAQDLSALVLDEGWLRQKLRMALDINSRDGIDELGPGVWRLGEARRAPVLLVRHLLTLWREPALLDRVRVNGGAIRVIAPRSNEERPPALGSGVDWFPMQERFALYAGGITLLEPGMPPAAAANPCTAVRGPFTADFRWVTVEGWPEGPIHCSPGQASVFEALWSFKGQPVNAQRIMQRAGLSSDKLVDVFKTKARNKGKPGAGGPKFAYDRLVSRNRREGLYWLACSANP